MAFLGLRRRDLTIQGMGNEEHFGLRWHRLLLPVENQLLFPAEGSPTVHFGPAMPAYEPPVADIHTGLTALLTLPMPLDADSPAFGEQDLGGAVPAGILFDAPATLIADTASPADGASPDWHPPYVAESPQSESPMDAPADSAPPEGFIPKSDALIWSGPAIMAFPPSETNEDAAAPNAGGPGEGAAPAIGDLSGAFLPPDSDAIGGSSHGLDLDFSFTVPPMPPPPEMI
jgi:hypothetical protein